MSATRFTSDTGSMKTAFLKPDVLVHKFAEAYQLPDLKSLSLSKFENAAVNNAIDVGDFVAAADEAFRDMHSFFDDIRNAVLHAFPKHREQLLADIQIRDLLYGNGVIGFHFIQYLLGNHQT